MTAPQEVIGVGEQAGRGPTVGGHVGAGTGTVGADMGPAGTLSVWGYKCRGDRILLPPATACPLQWWWRKKLRHPSGI